MAKLLIIVTLCFLSATLVRGGINKEEMIRKVLAKIDECKGEVNVAPTDIDELMKKKPASTMEGKCLRACLMKKLDFMDDTGKFNKASGIEKAKMITDNDPEKMKIATEIVDKCAGLDVPADHCEAAELYGKCFKDEITSRGIKEEI